MIMMTVLLMLLNVISGCFNIVKYVLEEEYDKKIAAVLVGTLNWAAVFVLVLTLIRQVQ